MSKEYSKFLPKKVDIETVPVQAHVPEPLHEEIRKVLKREDWTWSEFVCGLFEAYLDDSKVKRGS